MKLGTSLFISYFFNKGRPFGHTPLIDTFRFGKLICLLLSEYIDLCHGSLASGTQLKDKQTEFGIVDQLAATHFIRVSQYCSSLSRFSRSQVTFWQSSTEPLSSLSSRFSIGIQTWFRSNVWTILTIDGRSSHFTFGQFTRLRSFGLYDHCSPETSMNIMLNFRHLPYLTHLKITGYSFWNLIIEMELE